MFLFRYPNGYRERHDILMAIYTMPRMPTTAKAIAPTTKRTTSSPDAPTEDDEVSFAIHTLKKVMTMEDEKRGIKEEGEANDKVHSLDNDISDEEMINVRNEILKKY